MIATRVLKISTSMSTVTLLNLVVVSVKQTVCSLTSAAHIVSLREPKHFYTTGVLALVYFGRVSNCCAEPHVCKENCVKSFEKVNLYVTLQM